VDKQSPDADAGRGPDPKDPSSYDGVRVRLNPLEGDQEIRAVVLDCERCFSKGYRAGLYRGAFLMALAIVIGSMVLMMVNRE
jgi:hypothetical protein